MDHSPERSPPPSTKAIDQGDLIEQILFDPEPFIGSVERETKPMWVWDDEIQDGNGKMVFRDISYVPGLYKIFDEILVNAVDNKQRDSKMSSLRIDIDSKGNKITIYNNGKGIPVTEHKEEKVYLPTMIFGHLLTSNSYDDNEKKVLGGRNGFGAKLCNIFSTQFKVETSCKEYGKFFSQVWTDNMSNAEEPDVMPATVDDFTRVTFQPDLARFNLKNLTKDIIALFSRRAFDVAASCKGVKVFLNGKLLPVSCFKEYINLFIEGKEDDAGNPLKVAHEVVNDHWEIAATVSDRGFQQISLVNSIATTQGGKHVDYIADQIVPKVAEIIKKKNKDGVNVKSTQIRNHLWLFVNCRTNYPIFDSHTKETMTSKSFGSKCTPSDQFFKAVTKVGIIESILSWAAFRTLQKRRKRLAEIPKLEDANDAGTKNSINCRLILTEGDSAKTLVVAGLSVLGRDKFGVFPLRGKLLNVRDATDKQIVENEEINNIIKIVGLQYEKKYETREDLKSLRYGRIMIIVDPDQDGSHIKGLLINFIQYNWPSLLKLGFLEEVILPIVKAKKRDEEISFYSLPEFEEWKKRVPNWNSFEINYHWSLGSFSEAEAKNYFSDMRRHRIKFTYNGAEDDYYMRLAFCPTMADERKDWLTRSLEERKHRRELGQPEMYLYEEDTRQVSCKDFVNKELVLFSHMNNERSIPSLVDGLKPVQRKVVFTCLNDDKVTQVAHLAGIVGEKSAYHHSEASLMSTITNLAQNYVGSNNINILQPIGQFGTRREGGKDAARPHYISTQLSPLARKLFPSLDDPLLKSLIHINTPIEPEYYVPIIPMVLVNGAEGIGTGWSTKIPNYNPREITENIRRMIRGEDIEPMMPWYKGFSGTIDQVGTDSQKFVVNSDVTVLNETSFEITELPIRTWTQTYKETVLEGFLNGNDDRSPAFITDYKEHYTNGTVRFLISMTEANLRKALADGLHKTFKLQSTISTTSMVLYDGNGCLKKYETPEEIMREFFDIRLQFYVKRKAYCEGLLEAEVLLLTNQARYARELIESGIDWREKEAIFDWLIENKYDSDPMKAWKKKNAAKEAEEEEAAAAAEAGSGDEAETGENNAYDFEYLYDMPMSSMLRENVAELLKKLANKKIELEELRRLTPQQLWERDLDAFVTELDIVEKKERDEASRVPKCQVNLDSTIEIIDSDDDDTENTTPVKRAEKRKSSGFEDDDEEEAFARKPTKKIKKTTMIASDSESADSDIETVASSQSSTTGRPARSVRQRKPVSYKAIVDSDSELSESEPSEQSTTEEDDDDSDDMYEMSTKKTKF